MLPQKNRLEKSLSYKGKDYTSNWFTRCSKCKNQILHYFLQEEPPQKLWAPKFAEVGTTVVDNSSAWRMDPTKKLVVPEINGNVLTKEDKIIANPNCSTIQLVMALAPLHKKYKMKRVVISTYQSVSGTGVKAVEQLENEDERN